MTKHNPRELVARVKAIIRTGERASRPSQNALHLGDLVIDPGRREVRVAGQEIDLRAQEFDLLLTFVKHKGFALTREQSLKKHGDMNIMGRREQWTCMWGTCVASWLLVRSA